MSQSRKSLEEGKKTGKKSDKKEKGAEEDVKHSDLSDSSTQDITKESKKRKHSDGQSVEGEVPTKQQKRESGKEGDSEKDEKKQKKKRDRRKKKKSHKDKTLPELRVLPKKEWLKLREEYLSLQKKSMSELKESLKQIKENQPTDTGDNDAEKVTKPEVTTELVETPDVIIRVQCASDMNRKEIKEDLGTEVNVAYIDVKEGARDGYIRFKDADSAKKISESSIKSYLFNLLKGDDERAYWQKLKSDREAKHNTKSSRKKVKGTQKLIDRTEKINKENVSRVHIKFDDDDE
ncbi:hypothetical protein FSP39_008923 [Pinctada imbricata]|uniref:XRRM domain-containing protein n=1 Tax=Pinctada imbricata TaxID=66713 RepID=A0AA88XTC3_PINIB|nr:hypothetical protein FSP39_008923 [Pinctada imbricata]